MSPKRKKKKWLVIVLIPFPAIRVYVRLALLRWLRHVLPHGPAPTVYNRSKSRPGIPHNVYFNIHGDAGNIASVLTPNPSTNANAIAERSVIVHRAWFALCASFPGLKLSDVPVRRLVLYVLVAAKAFLLTPVRCCLWIPRISKKTAKNTWCYVGNMKYNTIGTSSLAAEGKKSTLTIYAEADSTRDKVRICIFTKPPLGLRNKFCLYCCLTLLSTNLQLSRCRCSSIWFYWPNSTYLFRRFFCLRYLFVYYSW